jgi:hypothetical protein
MAFNVTATLAMLQARLVATPIKFSVERMIDQWKRMSSKDYADRS